MATLLDLTSGGSFDLPGITAHLDSLDSATRINEVRTLGRKPQAALFEAASGYRKMTIEDCVPAEVPADTEIVHHGKNTLGVFSHFAKVMFRPEGGAKGELWGYNRNSGFLETVVGPGYFVTVPHIVPGEIMVDYLRLPAKNLPGWPPILPNTARLSRFVYNGTQDILRGVSKHVSIGRATKGGKPMDAWFILCRG